MPEPASDPTPTRSHEKTRGHKKKERTRRQLLAAAIDVIAERGEAFSASDVVERAGVSNGTFYNYFDDRDRLIDAVVPEVLASFAIEGAVRVDAEDPATRFATITALALLRAVDRPDAIRVILRVDAVQRALLDGSVIGHLRADLLAGRAEGRLVFASVDAALDVVAGSMLAASRRIVDGLAEPDHPRAIVEQLLCSLGCDRADAIELAARAVDAARELEAEPRPAATPEESR